jgi:tRNA A-37 threonylcarbamoyl transferase component Bud32
VPTARALNEIAWLDVAGRVVPDGVPRVRAVAPVRHVFLMEAFPPPRWRSWKSALLDGEIDAAVAARLGTLVGSVHGATLGERAIGARFADPAPFRALRVEPFLHALHTAHGDLADFLTAIESDLETSPKVLVHGDTSPKNVLVDDDGAVVLLDAECAWWGAPHFDAAFAITHLMLKWARAPEHADALEAAVHAFRRAWRDALDLRPADADAVDVRLVLLLPALLLARVDGASPVDYLDAGRAGRVRSFARTQLRVRPTDLDTLLARWRRATGALDA